MLQILWNCNCLLNHTGWETLFLLHLGSGLYGINLLSTLKIKECYSRSESEKRLCEPVWEAVSFKTVTLNQFSSGVPDRCQILGTADSNPWPSDCRWASVLYQTKSGSAGRCSLLCFLWYCNLCWSEIKRYCPGVSYGNSFHHLSL